MEKCIKYGKVGNHNTLLVPEGSDGLNEWLCIKCFDNYEKYIQKCNLFYIQPERSKREDIENKKCPLCKILINPHEIYMDWFYCKECDSTYYFDDAVL